MLHCSHVALFIRKPSVDLIFDLRVNTDIETMAFSVTHLEYAPTFC